MFVRGNYRDAMFFSKPGQAALTEDDPTKLFARVFAGGVPSAGARPTPRPRQEFKKPVDAAQEHHRQHAGRIQAAGRSGQPDRPRAAGQPRLGHPRSGEGHRPGHRQRRQQHGLQACPARPAIGRLPHGVARPAGHPADGHRLRHHPRGQPALPDQQGGVQLGGRHRRHPPRHLATGRRARATTCPRWTPSTPGTPPRWSTSWTACKAMPDVDGRTVFDNTIVFWANELALGSHKFERAPYMLVAGKFPLPKGGFLRDRPLPAVPAGHPAERPAVQPGPGVRPAHHQLRPPDVAPGAAEGSLPWGRSVRALLGPRPAADLLDQFPAVFAVFPADHVLDGA